jgi:hypothetical protein
MTAASGDAGILQQLDCRVQQRMKAQTVGRAFPTSAFAFTFVRRFIAKPDFRRQIGKLVRRVLERFDL